VLQVSPDRPLERLVTRSGIERVTIDLDNPHVDQAMDVHALTFPGASFDAVLALAVLDVVADQPRALAELHRVLRPGGAAILQVSHDRQPELAANLAAAGFETELLRAADLDPAMIARHGLIAEEETFVARRR
jgi:SAM-dependent methyltransferase